LVDFSDSSPHETGGAVTTFVSGFTKRGAHAYQREELFLPVAGGFAYKDMELIATDGWGKFRVALEVNTGRTVLMRVFSDTIMDPAFLAEFIREAAQLGHNIVHESILPLEETVTGPAGARAVVHPTLLRPLDQLYAAGKRPQIDQTPVIAAKILDGLGYAHNYQGLDGKLRRTYHLHLHPSQVFVNGDFSECRIASLGYSQIYRNLTRAAKPRFREPGMEPATMPPEFFRARGARVQEKWSDIYSFGILLHYLFTGDFPFEGPTFEDYKFQHSKIYAAPVRLINPDAPEWIEPIILKCLEKEPEKRWDSTVELLAEFKRNLKKE
jgi:eukaryotic-like serine/threonine-protein kinase